MSQSAITVVLPNFNHGKYLRDSLPALLNQTHPPNEIIVVDDGSTDDSIKVVEDFASKYRQIKLVRLPGNRGSIEAITEGLKLVTSEYVCFAAADDLTFPHFFEDTIKLLDAHPKSAFCSGLAAEMDIHGKNMKLIECPNVRTLEGRMTPSLVAQNLIRLGGWFRGNTTIYRTGILNEEGGFDPALGPFTDAYTSMLLALKYGCSFINEPLGAIRASHDNFSTKTSHDMDALLDICTRAEAKMASAGPEIFYDILIYRWKRSWLFSMLYNNRKNLVLSDLINIDEKLRSHIFDYQVFRFFWRFARKNDFLMRLLFLLWLTPWDVMSSATHHLGSRRTSPKSMIIPETTVDFE